MARYASDTSVPVAKSQAEINATVVRYGADAFSFAQERTEKGEKAMVSFRIHDRLVRFLVVLPDRKDYETTETGRDRSMEAARKAWEQACRQRWRALSLAVKAKLEVVESGIATFEEEFLPYLVLPDGSTVAQHALPAVRKAYDSGNMPKALLPA